MYKPWNNWYHVNGNTYGAWLRGDERGFRSRHHRDHVQGDYKSPPPAGKYAILKTRSELTLARPPVTLDRKARVIAATTIAESLVHDGIELICLAVDDHHYHILARFDDCKPRKWIGLAKRRSALILSQKRLVEPGGVWAVRCRCLPIADRNHQINTVRYILDHKKRGAATWYFKDDLETTREALKKRKRWMKTRGESKHDDPNTK